MNVAKALFVTLCLMAGSVQAETPEQWIEVLQQARVSRFTVEQAAPLYVALVYHDDDRVQDEAIRRLRELDVNTIEDYRAIVSGLQKLQLWSSVGLHSVSEAVRSELGIQNSADVFSDTTLALRAVRVLREKVEANADRFGAHEKVLPKDVDLLFADTLGNAQASEQGLIEFNWILSAGDLERLRPRFERALREFSLYQRDGGHETARTFNEPGFSGKKGAKALEREIRERAYQFARMLSVLKASDVQGGYRHGTDSQLYTAFVIELLKANDLGKAHFVNGMATNWAAVHGVGLFLSGFGAVILGALNAGGLAEQGEWWAGPVGVLGLGATVSGWVYAITVGDNSTRLGQWKVGKVRSAFRQSLREVFWNEVRAFGVNVPTDVHQRHEWLSKILRGDVNHVELPAEIRVRVSECEDAVAQELNDVGEDEQESKPLERQRSRR